MLDLFSGIGGMSLAAEWAGIKAVAFCEIEPYCQKVLRKHWPHIPIYDDVRQLTRERLEKDGVIGHGRTIDIVCGGYPCQPFSVAGKRRGTEDDRHLWPEMFRIVQELKPTWVLGENVAGHVSLGLDDVLSDLESEGYTCRAFVLPALAVGAPHRRDRVFVVADTCGSGCEECDIAAKSNKSGYGSGGSDSFGANRSTQPGMGGVLDGVSARLDRHRWPAGLGQPQYEWEPPRVAVGIKNRVPRLKALGNAVVPQQVYPFFLAIKHVNSLRIP